MAARLRRRRGRGGNGGRRAATGACRGVSSIALSSTSSALGITTLERFGVVWASLSAGLLTLAVGAFSFGVVAALRRSWRVPVVTAAVAFALVFVIAVVALPIGIAASAGGINDSARKFAQASQYSPGVATAVLPMALGAEAGFHTQHTPAFSPLRQGVVTSAGAAVWPKLSSYTEQHRLGRATDYARAAGSGWRTVSLVLSALIILTWLAAVVVAVLRLRPSRAVDGAANGLLVGLTGAALTIAATVACTSHATVIAGDRLSVDAQWGVGWSAVTQTTAELAVVGLLAGALVARLARPAAGAPPPVAAASG